MKRPIIAFLTVISSAAILCSCGKEPAVPTNKLTKMYFDAWMKEYHPDLEKKGLGIYILDETPGTGEVVGEAVKYPFALLEFTFSTLDGKITNTSYEDVSKRLGIYDPKGHYGPKIAVRGEGNMYTSIDEAMNDMKVGGSRTFIAPGWLNTYVRHDSEETYVEKESGDDMIISIRVRDHAANEVLWEVDSVGRYAMKHLGKSSPADSLIYGLYYKELRHGKDTTWETDNYIWINYVGKYLNGKAFDTNIKDSAKFYGIYDRTASYEPLKIKWASDYKNLASYNSEENEDGTQSDNSKLITGFSRMIFEMKDHAKSTGVFYSGLGYSYDGSGSIPPFTPLVFEVEFVDEPNQ